MDCQCRDAAVLQLFGQVGNDELLVVPAQTGLHGDRQLDGIHHLSCYLQQLRDVLQHAGAGSLASHLLHRTAEVQVDHVRVRLFFHNLRRLHHLWYITSIDLYAHRSFRIIDGQLTNGALHRAHQCLGANELRIYHSCAEAFA